MVRSLRSSRPTTVEPVQTPGKLAAEEEAPSRVRREWVTPSYPTEEAHQMTDEEQSAKFQRLLTFWFDYGGGGERASAIQVWNASPALA